MRAQFIASEIGIGLRRNLTMTVAVVLTVAVSMFFFGFALVVQQQASKSRAFWYGEIELSVQLCGDVSTSASCAGPVTQAQRDAIRSQLEHDPEVANVTYESSQQAYDRFRKENPDDPIIDLTTPSMLPESYRVKLKNPEHFATVASSLQGVQGVDTVQDYRKVLSPLFGLLTGVRLVAYVFGGLMLLSAALLIFNTIRLAAFSRRRETGIMRLVGASSFYIQLPFILEGIVATLVGVAIAYGCLSAVQHFCVPWLERHIHITPFVGYGAVVWSGFWMVLVGVSLAAVASWLTLRRYLRV